MQQIHPKIPQSKHPKSIQEQIDWLRLCRSRRVGPATFVRLIQEHETPARALAELPNVAKASGVKNYEPYDAKAAERELDQGISMGLTPLFLGAPNYPNLLAQAGDAPAFLWAKGDIDLTQRPCVSLVGARNASSLGLRMAGSVARELGDLGYVVVSGLARGIDGATHSAALATGTIAVQAGGIDITYPKENTDLQNNIGKNGLCLSEQPIGLIPQARHFPQRNRIIAGISFAVVVIEGAARSGSLITARSAADLGREVMAVPGSPMDARASGCNILIRDGATLVRSATDIHEVISHNLTPPEDNQIPADNAPKATRKSIDISQTILQVLSANAVAEDVIIRDTGLPASDVSRQLTALEMAGKIERQAGGLLSLTV